MIKWKNNIATMSNTVGNLIHDVILFKMYVGSCEPFNIELVKNHDEFYLALIHGIYHNYDFANMVYTHYPDLAESIRIRNAICSRFLMSNDFRLRLIKQCTELLIWYPETPNDKTIEKLENLKNMEMVKKSLDRLKNNPSLDFYPFKLKYLENEFKNINSPLACIFDFI